MALAIVPREQGQSLAIAGVLTPLGIVVSEDATEEQCLADMAALRQMEGASAWGIGDYMRHVEHKHGTTYQRAAEATGYDVDTLKRAKWVSGQFEMCRRRHISWSHHLEVAKLPPEQQDWWLDVAERDGLSQKALRAAVRAADKGAALAAAAAQRTGDGTATIACATWDEWLPTQPDCDLLITDPPYSTDVPDVYAFAAEWLPAALSKVKPTGRAYVCIGSYPHELAAYLTADHADMVLSDVLIWNYNNTKGAAPLSAYSRNYQVILHFVGLEAGVLDRPQTSEAEACQTINAPGGFGSSETRYHAWQKPLELADMYIRHATRAGDVVLDPFAGTGTFLLAAATLGRDARGCDMDPAQVETAVARGCGGGIS